MIYEVSVPGLTHLFKVPLPCGIVCPSFAQSKILTGLLLR